MGGYIFNKFKVYIKTKNTINKKMSVEYESIHSFKSFYMGIQKKVCVKTSMHNNSHLLNSPPMSAVQII